MNVEHFYKIGRTAMLSRKTRSVGRWLGNRVAMHERPEVRRHSTIRNIPTGRAVASGPRRALGKGKRGPLTTSIGHLRGQTRRIRADGGQGTTRRSPARARHAGSEVSEPMEVGVHTGDTLIC